MLATYRLRRYRYRMQSRRQRLLRLFILILFVGSLSWLWHHVFSPQPVNPIQAQASPTPTATPTQTPLAQVVTSALQGQGGTYGIVIKNLKTGETYKLHEDTVFQSASLYKLWVMGLTYQQIQQRHIKEDEELSEKISVLNDKFYIASDDAELTDGTITLTVHNALNQMITISHNYAAMLLTEKISLNGLVSYLGQIGLTHSHIGFHGVEPTTTAGDIALFLYKLYQGNLANKQYTDEMVTLLKNQKLNNKLPRELPDDITVAHKTGELNEYTHDAGLVYTSQGNYLIVVLSKSSDPSRAEDTIAALSKAVYTYFTSQ